MNMVYRENISAILGDFRLEYKYEIEYEYDFSNQERILQIT